MFSRIISLALAKALEPFFDILAKGTFKAKIIGALVGAALTTLSAFVVWIEFVPILMVVGAFIGAVIAAAVFKKTLAGETERTADAEPFQVGALVKAWTFSLNEFRSMTVLLERAIYVVRDDQEPWKEVLEELSQNVYPDRPLGTIVRLDELARIEINQEMPTEIEFVHTPHGQVKKRAANFQTIEQRNDFIASMELMLGRKLTEVERPVKISQAIQNPVALLVFVVIVFSLLTWLAAHWTANPPPPPQGKTEQDPLVKMMLAAGPGGVVAVGAVVSLIIVAWLVRQYKSPPRIRVIPVHEEVASIAI